MRNQHYYRLAGNNMPLALLALVALLLVAPSPVRATDYTWVGGTSTSFGTSANWSPNTNFPGGNSTSDIASFDTAVGLISNQPSLSASNTIGALQFGTYGYTLSSGSSSYTLTLDGNDTVNSVTNVGIDATEMTTGTNVISAKLQLGANQTILVGTGGTIELSNQFINGSSYTVSIGSPSDTNSSGDAGTVILYDTSSSYTSNINTSVYSGELVLDRVSGASPEVLYGNVTIYNGGTVQLQGTGGNEIGTGKSVYLDGGTLDLNGQSQSIFQVNGSSSYTTGNLTNSNSSTLATLTVTGTSGTSAFYEAVTGNLAINNNGTTSNSTPVLINFYNTGNTYTGSTTVSSSGAIYAEATNSLSPNSAFILDNVAPAATGGAALYLNNYSNIIGSLSGGGSSGGNVSLGSGTLTTGNDGTSTSYSGVISGTGGLTKEGAGVFTLAGVNTYNGATSITGGSLLLANGGGLSATSGVNVSAGADFGTPTTNASKVTLLSTSQTLSLALGNTSTTKSTLQLNLYSTGNSDTINTSVINLSGSGSFDLVLNNASGGSLSQSYDLLNWTGNGTNFSSSTLLSEIALSGSAASLGGLSIQGDSLEFVTAVPEPSSYALLLLGLGGLLFARTCLGRDPFEIGSRG